MSRKKKTFTQEQLKCALSAVRQKKMKIRKAAREFQVPKSTLHDHLTGKLKSVKPGPAPMLTVKEEGALVNYLMYMSKQGFPLTRDMMRCFVRDIVKQSDDIKSNITTLVQTCTETHSYVTSQEYCRPIAFNHSTIRLSLNIFNCDETGFSGKEMARAKVFGKKGQHVFRRRTSTTDHITAHLCVCADGRFLPSFVIFQGSLPHRNYKDRVPDNWLFAYSESGYMDRELFNNWFTKIFLPHCGRERPVVLILDNHDTHVSISLIEEARANRIILAGLPAHTTHILQPLDVKIIGPLKERYCSMAANLGQTSTNMVIGKTRFPLILKYAIDKSSPDAISEAFAVTGVHPFNPEAIDKSQLITPTLNNDESPDNISTPSSACPTCGSYLTNPLVVHGLIPTSLANILVPPPAKPKQQPKNRRIVTSARILSGEEMLQQLKEREELQKKKIEERNNRKIEMEKKRQEKQKLHEEKRVRRLKQKEERMEKKEIEEKNKKQRKLIREERKAAREQEKEEKRRMKQLSKVSMEEIAAAREYVCNVRGIEGTVFDEANGIQWYGCDEEQCKRWYHDDCLTRPELEMVLESLEDGGAWYCRMCKPWMYEEE